MLYVYYVLLHPLFVGVCVRSLFCYARLNVLSSFLIISLWMRELVIFL